MNIIRSRSSRYSSSKYLDLGERELNYLDLKSEIKEAMKSMGGKPEEISITRVTQHWNCPAGDLKVLADLENPTKNKYYRIALAVMSFSPLLADDTGVGKITIINESLIKEKRLTVPILSVQFACNEHCTYITGSDQWIDSAKGKVSVLSQCNGSLVKTGSDIIITDAVLVYQHSSRPIPIRPVPFTKYSKEVLIDKIENYMEDDRMKVGHV